MKITRLILLAGLALLGGSRIARANEGDLSQALALEKTMQKAIARAEPSIACILVSRSDVYRKIHPVVNLDEGNGQLGPFDPDWLKKFDIDERKDLLRRLDLADPNVVPESFGSGVVIDAGGFVLTNYHVVRDATKIFVRLPGNKSAYADIHAADPRCDLAVLRLLLPFRDQAKFLPLPAQALGGGEKLKRGQFVLSLANPYAAGFRDGQPSASWGIVSNIRRRAPGQLREEDRLKSLHQHGTLLQLDARLNLGCSGGALLDLQGELVGMTTALAAIQGGETPGGFAIPFDAGMRRIVEVLLRGEEVDYGFLGVGFSERTGESGPGVSLSHVTPGSPAELDAKLRMGDRILAVSGVPVQDSDDLFLQLGTRLAGSRVELDVKRAGVGLQKTEVKLAKFHVPGKKIASSLGKRPFFRGLRVDYASVLVPHIQRTIPAGVLITEVQPGSPAANAYLRSGEVISAVKGQPVATPADFYRVVASAQGPIELRLAPLSESGAKSIVVKLLPQ